MKPVALSLLAAALLSAVTPALAYGPVQKPIPKAGDTTFSGWVVFSGGEFQLYANRNQVL